MKSLLASVRREDGHDRVESAVQSLEEQWRDGEPALEKCWTEHDPGRTISVLAALVKADLRCHFARGRSPAVSDYLERFPVLRDASERVLSLIYEEFCLRQERGEQPDPESFCARYAPWRDSLALQLKYHQLLSHVVGPPSAPPRYPEPGERFEEFALDSLLGQGGAARVYRARNGRLGGREVALKISPDRGQEPSIMGRLEHAHIVPVQHVVVQHATQLRGLIMPYRPGLPLDEVIKRVRPSCQPEAARVLWDTVAASVATDLQPEDEPAGWNTFPMEGTYAQGVAWIIGRLADAVAYAHARGVQHRDIKPANVLLTLHNGPQLLDFNLAHDPHAAEQAAAALRGGTLPYMAPEQLEAFLNPDRWNAVDFGADLYSLGLVMHELLTGLAPAVPDPAVPLPRAIRGLLDLRADQSFNLRRLNPALPHALEAITLRCLAYSPSDRYAGVHELAEDLYLFQQGKPLRYAVNPSVSERLRNWGRRNWGALAASAMLAALGTGLASHYLTPIERRSEFREAMAAVDDRTGAKALALLAPLAEKYPDSPLVQLYYSTARASANDLRGAAAWYKKATLLPDAETVFGGWAREYPGVIQQFENLGIRFYDATIQIRGTKKADPLYHELGHRAVLTAIHLGSTDERTLLRNALHDDEQEDYDSALRKMTAVIDQIERIRGERLRNKRLNENNCFRSRARTWIHLGDRALSRETGASLEKARSCFENALVDLNRARSLANRDDTTRLDSCMEFGASAELGLVKIAIRQERYDEAQVHRRKFNLLLEQLRERHGGQPAFQALEDQRTKLEELIPTSPEAELSAAR
jgi:serine/threonine protein kinase